MIADLGLVAASFITAMLFAPANTAGILVARWVGNRAATCLTFLLEMVNGTAGDKNAPGFDRYPAGTVRLYVSDRNTTNRTARNPQAVTNGAVVSLATIGPSIVDNSQTAIVDPNRETRLTTTKR